MYVHTGDTYLSIGACDCFMERIQIVSQVRGVERQMQYGKVLHFPERVAPCKCFAERIQIVSRVRGAKKNTPLNPLLTRLVILHWIVVRGQLLYF